MSSSILFSQNNSLFIPKDIQKAIDYETRSNNGEPGKNYWQNKSEYKIDAEVFTDSSILVGEETIKYYNNSPDTLDRIVIRLYQDIAKPGATRDRYVSSKYLGEGLIINRIIVDNDTLDISNESRDIISGSTNMIVTLEQPLAPNKISSINVKWQFKIPKIWKIRMGNYGEGNFFIAYWYPQISVYDDIDGWDMINYEGSVEFYNDFSNYDVNIKVPGGFVTWATGELQNGKEVLREDIYKKYEQAKKSDETIRIITAEDYKNGLVTSENEKNIWHFKAENVTDFSFALSKSFNWDGASVVVDESNGRRALADVAYENGTVNYDKAAQYARASVEYLSKELPGFPYPYSHVTSFCNGSRGGGMESPMMANNGAPIDIASHVGLIFHEISHNYFPFMMGTNERKYAWMDEGWAAFYPTEIVDRYAPNFDYLNNRVRSYERNAGNESELPPITVSYSYKSKYMRTGFYDRPAIAYNELMNLLDREKFKNAMLVYINRWFGKHPIPLDFFNSINDAVGEDLSWFWKPWFYEFGYPDLTVKNVENNNGNVSATILKVGNIPTQVEVTFEYEDGTNEIVNYPASVWKDGNKELVIKLEPSKKVKSVKVGNSHIPDSIEENDVFLLLN
ncbi:MAG: M1 family metallopeptidase [Ignavibacteriales bacterium]|nr:M1 family metallopeptidase [Ignavibacteriales bacterium]